MKRRLICGILLLTLVLSCCLGAQAEDSSLLLRIVNAGETLLFHTDNVTLTGEASFSMDGEAPFKKAETEYVQARTYSYWRLKLLTPWPDGEKQTGFTVIANDRKIYAMEDYHPGVYRTGYDEPQMTILRNSRALTQLVSLAKGVAPEWEKTLTDQLTAEDGTVVLKLTRADIPASVNSLLNLGAQLAGRRLFQVDYDRMSGYELAHMEDFTTVTQGILAATIRFTVQEAELQVRLDNLGRIAEASGSVKAEFETYNDGVHTLEVTFSGEAGQYGESKVDGFDPEAWGVTLQPDETVEVYVPVEGEYPGETVEYGDAEPSALFKDWEPEKRDPSAVSLPLDESAFSERYLKIRQAEQALRERYGVTPEMQTFFSRKVTEEDGSLTLSLTGMNDYFQALGTYTAEVTAEGVKTAWSHDGENADSDAFTAPVWGAAQLEKMLEITKRTHEVTSFYDDAVRIAREADPDYEMPLDSLEEYIMEYLDQDTIRSRCRYTLDELIEIGRQGAALAYGLTEEQKNMFWSEDDYPEFHFEDKDGKLIYQAWMSLGQQPYPAWTERDGIYEVLVNAENGQIEDIIYDSSLNGNG